MTVDVTNIWYIVGFMVAGFWVAYQIQVVS